MKTIIRSFLSTIALVVCFQSPILNAMNLRLSSEERFPKKQAIEQNQTHIIPTAQKCPRPEYLQLVPDFESPIKKQKTKHTTDVIPSNTIKAMKSPRPMAEFAAAIHSAKKQIIKQEDSETDFEITEKNICDECSKNFIRKYDLTTHKNTVHSDERPYNCDECDAHFKTKSNLKQHKNHVHSDERPYACKQCDIRCKSKGNLELHRAGCHSNIRFTCSICSAGFKREDYLLKHENSVHATTRPYLCDHGKCNKNFKTKEELSLHIRRHIGEKSHICECGKGFISKSELDQHKVIHSDEKPHICEQCGECFKFQRSFIRHTNTVHSDTRPYNCDYDKCDKSFKTKSELKRHMERHSDKKQYICECGKDFTTKNDLNCHKMVHLDERPHHCEQCGKSFALSARLKRHQKESCKGKPKKS